MDNFAIMFVIGCIYLGSTSAFNAFIGTGLVLQHVTYALPTALLLMRQRSEKWLPEVRSFKLPSVVGVGSQSDDCNVRYSCPRVRRLPDCSACNKNEYE